MRVRTNRGALTCQKLPEPDTLREALLRASEPSPRRSTPVGDIPNGANSNAREMCSAAVRAEGEAAAPALQGCPAPRADRQPSPGARRPRLRPKIRRPRPPRPRPDAPRYNMPIQRKKQPRLYAGVKQDQRIPNKTGHVAFVDVGEERMKWQRTVSETDALYQLPDTRSRCGTPFGTSTRSDWENTMKSKRDLYNPYASPGNYNPPLNVTLRAPPSIKFGYSTRLERYGRNKTPGPDYNIDGIYSNGPTCGRVKLGFAKSKRKDLIVSATDASYFPRFPKGKSAPLTGRNFFGLKEEKSRSPGPVYDTAKYDFGKPAANVIGFPGGHFSFGAGRNFDRFKLRDQPMILSAELR